MITDKTSNKYSPDYNKLLNYGFKKSKNGFSIEQLFYNDLFRAHITVDFDGNLLGTVYEVESSEEFLPLRIKDNQGSFVSDVRYEYENLLSEIYEKCFSKKYYIYPQSNRITDLIIKKYGDYPEFLWETTPGSGIFRNPDTKKWYLAILDVDRSKIQPERTGLVEVALLKLNQDEVQEIIKQEHFYPGYHMNKKYWITVILDDSVTDTRIMELIEKSHSFTVKTKH